MEFWFGSLGLFRLKATSLGDMPKSRALDHAMTSHKQLREIFTEHLEPLASTFFNVKENIPADYAGI